MTTPSFALLPFDVGTLLGSLIDGVGRPVDRHVLCGQPLDDIARFPPS